MKKISLALLSQIIVTRRKTFRMTQAQLAAASGMNRSMLSKLETQEYTPSIDQLQALAEILEFDPTEVFIEPQIISSENVTPSMIPTNPHYRIAVAGTGYVGLSLAVLLAQHNHVTAVDIIPEKI